MLGQRNIMPVYYNKESHDYFVRMYLTDVYGNRKQHKFSGFATKKEALDFEAEMRLKDGKFTNVCNMTLGKLYEEYKSYKKGKLKPQGFRTTMSRIERHILPYFGDCKIKEINHTKYIKWQNEIEAKGFKYKYKSSIHTAFSTLLEYAIEFYGLEINVAKKVGNFKKGLEIQKEVNFWDYEEYTKFISVVDDPIYKMLFETMYFTGMRIGEALALNWNDLGNDYIDISKTIAKDVDKKTGKHIINTPKTPSSKRKIKIDDILMNHLLELKKYYKDFIGFEDNWFIFGGLNSLAQTTVSRKFKKYIDIAEVKQIKIHEIRHSHASLLLSVGTPSTVVQNRLGHSNLETTLNIYSHMLPKDEDKAVSNITNIRQQSNF